MTERLDQLLAAGGGILTMEPGLGPSLTRAVGAGELRRLLPGVYCSVALASDVVTQARALMAHDPHAVVVGRAAAALTWWPELRSPWLEAWRAGPRAQSPGYRWTQCSVPAERVMWHNGIRMTDPALTVLDLIPTLEGQPIDEALRRRVVTLDDLWTALRDIPRRRGNPIRARLLHDSRDEPWSEAERMLHTLIRGLELPYLYRTNMRVTTPALTAFLDLALPELRLAFEVDGFEFHRSRTAFIHDRTRDLELSAGDWEVHRIPAATVQDEPERVASLVLSIVGRRASSLGLRPLAPHGGRRGAGVSGVSPTSLSDKLR